jgi:hypothetical protein
MGYGFSNGVESGLRGHQPRDEFSKKIDFSSAITLENSVMQQGLLDVVCTPEALPDDRLTSGSEDHTITTSST